MPDAQAIQGDRLKIMREWCCKALAPDNSIAYSTTVVAELDAHAAQEAAEEYDDSMYGDVADEQRILVIGPDGSAVVWWVEGEREGEPDGYRRDWYATTTCAPTLDRAWLKRLTKAHNVPGQLKMFEETC